ncbi:hypothetical protein OROMI_026387 [Orobanche minor]
MASHFRAETIALEGSYKDIFFQLLSQLFFIWSSAPFKVLILLRATGDASILRQSEVKVDALDKFMKVLNFFREQLHRDTLPLPRTVAAGNFVFATSDNAAFVNCRDRLILVLKPCPYSFVKRATWRSLAVFGVASYVIHVYLSSRYHASLVENESSAIGSYADEEPV